MEINREQNARLSRRYSQTVMQWRFALRMTLTHRACIARYSMWVVSSRRTYGHGLSTGGSILTKCEHRMGTALHGTHQFTTPSSSLTSAAIATTASFASWSSLLFQSIHACGPLLGKHTSARPSVDCQPTLTRSSRLER